MSRPRDRRAKIAAMREAGEQPRCCPTCKKLLTSDEALVAHMRDAHRRRQELTSNPEPEPPPAPVCPYCEEEAEFWPSSAMIYHGRDYGPVWICEPCQAWVGCHEGTNVPLGRLADKELRKAKMAAHAAFDPLWRAKIAKERCSKRVARGAAYAWLAEQLGVDPLYCHIGLFDVERCKRVVELCAPFRGSAVGRAAA